MFQLKKQKLYKIIIEIINKDKYNNKIEAKYFQKKINKIWRNQKYYKHHKLLYMDLLNQKQKV